MCDLGGGERSLVSLYIIGCVVIIMFLCAYVTCTCTCILAFVFSILYFALCSLISACARVCVCSVCAIRGGWGGGSMLSSIVICNSLCYYYYVPLYVCVLFDFPLCILQFAVCGGNIENATANCKLQNA